MCYTLLEENPMALTSSPYPNSAKNFLTFYLTALNEPHLFFSTLFAVLIP